ncbi:MAG: hypothetical protein SWH78_17585 [Thermodesulfobacteriota bacterium]|nr:hypothetical protein [Thermodesulfobacteriota bacterium]
MAEHFLVVPVHQPEPLPESLTLKVQLVLYAPVQIAQHGFHEL